MPWKIWWFLPVIYKETGFCKKKRPLHNVFDSLETSLKNFLDQHVLVSLKIDKWVDEMVAPSSNLKVSAM